MLGLQACKLIYMVGLPVYWQPQLREIQKAISCNVVRCLWVESMNLYFIFLSCFAGLQVRTCLSELVATDAKI